MRILFQVLGHMAGKQDVSGVAAIHDALRHVNSGAGDAGGVIHISNSGDRTAMHAHSQRQFWMCFQGLADFEGAIEGFFWAPVENERHAVARGTLD